MPSYIWLMAPRTPRTVCLQWLSQYFAQKMYSPINTCLLKLLTLVTKILLFLHFSIVSWYYHPVKSFQANLKSSWYSINCKDRLNQYRITEYQLNLFYKFNLYAKLFEVY